MRRDYGDTILNYPKFCGTCGAASVLRPVFELEALHAFELALIVRDEDEPRRQRMGRDPQIIGTDGVTLGRQGRADDAIGSSSVLRHRENHQKLGQPPQRLSA